MVLRKSKKLKNTLLALSSALALTACGGGGGGGAVDVVNDFVEDLSNLSGSASLVSSYSDLLSDFQSVVSGGDMSAIQGVITGPDAGDIDQANALLTQLQTAKNLWEATEHLIDQQNDSDKYTIYNSDSFKQAHAAMLYLQNYVKPVIQKVANGQTITLADYNLVDKESRANEIIEQEKNSTSSAYANNKKIKSVQTIINETPVSTVANDIDVVHTEWAVVEGQGQETRTRTTTTTPVTTTVTTRCTLQRTTFLNNSTSDGAESCSVLDPVITQGTATVVAETETRVGNAVVVDKTRTDVLDPVTSTETPVLTYTEWATVHAGGGQETRTRTTTTRNKRTVITQNCTWQESTVNGATTKGAETCTTTDTQVTYLDDTVETATETREGENPVTATVNLDPTVATETENSANYTETTYTDASDTTTETEEGSATTNTSNRDVTVVDDNGNNTSTTVVTRYVDTIVTTPITTKVYRTRNYTDTVKRNTRTITTTTPRQQLTYRDGTSEIINGTATVVNGDWSTTQLSESSRSENILQSETTEDQVVTTSDSGTELSRVTASNTYSNNDTNLGTQTTGLSSNASDFRTTEFNKDTSKTIINADKAYARGWTGAGSVLGVVDTYQQTDHESLDGQYEWYNNYVRYEDGTLDDNGNELGTVANGGGNVSHGTHVAGIVAGKRDGTGFHGVAFDSKLVGANIDYYGNGTAHISYAAQAIQDITKLKSTVAQGGEGLNVVAINMSFNKAVANVHYGNITELSDGTYSASAITSTANGNGEAWRWKVATDNDIVLVNSAGNGIYVNGQMNYDFALDPGLWATETDSSGNLVLGGKMIIVGNWGGTKADGQVVGSRAGHVCLTIVNNACNDQYKVSDFYILAPGNNVYSSSAGDGYVTMGGSSMAAPQVTGAIGILHQMWPHMKGENLVKLVLNTADKNINGYNENIHGQGMLDLDEATQPQGAIGIPTTGRVDGTVTSLNNTYFATGNTSAFSSLANLKIMVIDDYDRDYYMNLGSGMTVKDNRKYSDVSMLMANNNTYLPQQQMYGSFAQGGQWDLVKDYNFGFYTGENGSGDYSANIGKNFMLHKNLKLKTSIGQMSEQDTWLGNSSDGILAVGDNNNTNFGNLGVEYALGNNVLSLDYTRGKTGINTTDGSLIKGFSDVQTESYRLAYEVHKDTHTTFGWSFSLPSHITSGSMDLEVAESVNLDGTINYTNIKSDLTQSTKEKNIGFFYSKTPEHDLDATINFTAEYRQDVAGQSGKDGVNLAFNYVKKFSGACGFLWMKNPKCYNEDGSKKDMKALYAAQGKEVDNATKHGLVYDLETDKFIPINKKK